VNSSPGLRGIEEATGRDVAGIIVEHAEKNYQRRLARKRRRG
jgi:ribosomal protein S6--L-glutamate ligase